jgi:hypothetical protein
MEGGWRNSGDFLEPQVAEPRELKAFAATAVDDGNVQFP